MVLVAGIDDPHKVGQTNSASSNEERRPKDRKSGRDRRLRWGGGGAYAGAPVTRTGPAAARSNLAQLGGSLTEQTIRLVVKHMLSLHHIHGLGVSPRASGKYRAGADFSDDKAMVRPGVATRVGSRETGVDPSAGLWAEELNGCWCRPIGAWTPSQPVGYQGDISTFLLCSKGARRWAPLRAPPRLRLPTGTRQTRQCLRYSFQTGVRRCEYHANPPSGADVAP